MLLEGNEVDTLMGFSPGNKPLSESEFDRLGSFLAACKGGNAMSVEELDGFFAALIAGPELVPPSEYYPEVFGGDLADVCQFESLEDAQEVFGLMMRHWNAIASTLSRGDGYEPVLVENESGAAHANDWADGFMRGMQLCREGWARLLHDDKDGGCLIPVLMLYHEHDPDPATRTNPISPKQREELIVGLAAGLVRAYHYFRERLPVYAADRISRGSTGPRLGRNDPCPCGSGRKYKRCCGRAAVQ